jgi:predicted metal-dependent phosphotriesterase family hydrolase
MGDTPMIAGRRMASPPPGEGLVTTRGYGYHLLVTVVPRLRRKGVDDAGLRRPPVDNPARAFVVA